MRRAEWRDVQGWVNTTEAEHCGATLYVSSSFEHGASWRWSARINRSDHLALFVSGRVPFTPHPANSDERNRFAQALAEAAAEGLAELAKLIDAAE